MRYISLLFILFLMGVSWAAMHSPSAVPETTHIDIQDDIKSMIRDTVAKAIPQVKDLKFDRFWTQSVTKDQVKAVFSFSFENAAEATDRARYGISGHALLTYDAATGRWNLKGPYFENNEITFKDGMIIRPGQDTEEDSPASDGPSSDGQ
jgi:hypothetical protein